jgi:hypothetical protein
LGNIILQEGLCTSYHQFCGHRSGRVYLTVSAARKLVRVSACVFRLKLTYSYTGFRDDGLQRSIRTWSQSEGTVWWQQTNWSRNQIFRTYIFSTDWKDTVFTAVYIFNPKCNYILKRKSNSWVFRICDRGLFNLQPNGQSINRSNPEINVLCGLYCWGWGLFMSVIQQLALINNITALCRFICFSRLCLRATL